MERRPEKRGRTARLILYHNYRKHLNGRSAVKAAAATRTRPKQPNGTRAALTGCTVSAYREFESISLQRGVMQTELSAAIRALRHLPSGYLVGPQGHGAEIHPESGNVGSYERDCPQLQQSLEVGGPISPNHASCGISRRERPCTSDTYFR